MTTNTTNNVNTNLYSENKSTHNSTNKFKNDKNVKNELSKQSNLNYINENFNKPDSSSFYNELSYTLRNFTKNKFPELDMENKKIINNKIELDAVLSEVSGMKNFYTPGDIVSSGSSFDITKNDICYKNNNLIKNTPDFMTKYPNCMVCAVENESNLYNTQSWKNTKTNISKVCLYNPTATSNSGIPNLEQCKTFCNVK